MLHTHLACVFARLQVLLGRGIVAAIALMAGANTAYAVSCPLTGSFNSNQLGTEQPQTVSAGSAISLGNQVSAILGKNFTEAAKIEEWPSGNGACREGSFVDSGGNPTGSKVAAQSFVVGDDASQGIWESDIPVCAVVVKTGGQGNQATVFEYDPDTTLGSWTTGGKDISFIAFIACDGNGGGQETATIKLKKITTATDATGIAQNTFTLKLTRTSDNQEFTAALTVNGIGKSQEASFSLPPGSYIFSEILPTDPNIPANSSWEKDSLTCTSDVANPTSNILDGNLTSTIDLVADDTVTCTATNRLEREDDGNGIIRIVKIANGGDDTFQFNVTGPTNDGFSLQGGESKTIPNAPAGSYTIAESSLPAGWILQDINCGRGTRTDDQIDFNLADGESVVCTFTNFKEDDDPADDVTKVFIHRRVDNLLTHGPDRARVLRRLDEQPTGSLKDSDRGSYEPLKFTGSIKDGKGDVKFSTSLSQMRAAAAAADKKKISEAGLSFNDTYAGYYAPQAMTQRLDLWVEGQMTSYDDTTGGINRDGNFRILYTGMDYAVTPGILVGGLIQIDHTEEDVNNPDMTGKVEGRGWMAGPYLGLKLQESLFFDARAAWGKSSNDLDLTDNVVGRRTGSFETDRWLATATLTGNYYHEGLRISPHVGVAYGNEVSDAYKTSLGQNVGAADVTLGKVTFGPEFGYRTTLENGTTVEPHISLKGIWNFDGDTLELSSGPVKIDDFRAQIEGGVIVKSIDGYSFRAAGSYDGIGDSNLDAWSAKGWLNIPLH